MIPFNINSLYTVLHLSVFSKKGLSVANCSHTGRLLSACHFDFGLGDDVDSNMRLQQVADHLAVRFMFTFLLVVLLLISHSL